MFQQVTEDSYHEWESKYPGSSMERDDVKDYYNKYKGKMKHVTDCIPFLEDEDLWRIKELVDSMIESGELEVTDRLHIKQPAYAHSPHAGRKGARDYSGARLL